MPNATNLFSLSALMLACASSPPPAQSAESTAPARSDSTATPSAAAASSSTETEQSAQTEAPTDASAPAKETASSDKPPEPAAPAEEPSASKLSSSPRAILTAPDVAYIVDYANSAPKQAAEEKCEAEAEGDLAARAACMTKARDEFLADVIRFKKEGAKWVMITYKRKSSNLIEVHTTTFDFGEEKENSIELKPKGAEQGQRPLFKGMNKMLIKVPNEYSIELDDPKHGRLRYDAKVGMVGR
jgi:hypothetical protein